MTLPPTLFAPTLLGVSPAQLAIAFVVIFAGFAWARLVSYWFNKARERFGDADRFRYALLEAADRPLGWAFILTAIYFALSVFSLPKTPIDVRHFIDTAMLAASIALGIWFGTGLIDALCALWAKHATASETPFDDTLVPIVRKSCKVFLVVAGGVMIVQNLGYSVGSLLAGLGLGGAALALASKDTIANLFGSIVIFLDQPFYVGDWIEIGDNEGVVEEVGLRVTRIRTFANSLITIPNAQLTTLTINNWSRMRKRRIVLNVGLTYDTTPSQLRAAVEALRQVLREDPRICQDFFLVNFNGLGAYSLDIYVYCFTATTDWAEHLQIREDVLLRFMAAIDALGLRLAMPSQTVQVTALEKLIPPGTPAGMSRQLPG